jgi:hypothetical protein
MCTHFPRFQPTAKHCLLYHPTNNKTELSWNPCSDALVPHIKYNIYALASSSRQTLPSVKWLHLTSIIALISLQTPYDLSLCSRETNLSQFGVRCLRPICTKLMVSRTKPYPMSGVLDYRRTESGSTGVNLVSLRTYTKLLYTCDDQMKIEFCGLTPSASIRATMV